MSIKEKFKKSFRKNKLNVKVKSLSIKLDTEYQYLIVARMAEELGSPKRNVKQSLAALENINYSPETRRDVKSLQRGQINSMYQLPDYHLVICAF